MQLKKYMMLLTTLKTEIFFVINEVGRHFVAQLSAGLLCQRQRQGLSPFHLQGSCRFRVKACTVFRIRLRQIILYFECCFHRELHPDR